MSRRIRFLEELYLYHFGISTGTTTKQQANVSVLQNHYLGLLGGARRRRGWANGKDVVQFSIAIYLQSYSVALPFGCTTDVEECLKTA